MIINRPGTHCPHIRPEGPVLPAQAARPGLIGRMKSPGPERAVHRSIRQHNMPKRPAQRAGSTSACPAQKAGSTNACPTQKPSSTSARPSQKPGSTSARPAQRAGSASPGRQAWVSWRPQRSPALKGPFVDPYGKTIRQGFLARRTGSVTPGRRSGPGCGRLPSGSRARHPASR